MKRTATTTFGNIRTRFLIGGTGPPFFFFSSLAAKSGLSRNPEITPIKAGAGLIASRAKVSVLPIHIKTKEYRIKAFRKVKLIIGEPIPYEEYTNGGELEGDSRAITQYIFDRIIALGKEEDK